MPGWQNICRTAAEYEIRGWSSLYPTSTNTGILGGTVVGVDIDVPDEELSEHLVARSRAMLGGSQLQRIGRAPKTLFCYRVDAPIRKLQTPDLFFEDGTKQKVEVLAEGQQFAAFGIHPDTREPYRWPELSPLDTRADELPLVTLEALQAFVAESELLIRAAGGLTERERKASKEKEHGFNSVGREGDEPRSAFGFDDKPDRSTVEDALRYVPNDFDYDGWVRIGFALYDGLGDGGRDLWERWSAQSGKNDPATTARKWPTFASGRSITRRTLFWEAMRNGWRQSGGADTGSSRPEAGKRRSSHSQRRSPLTCGATLIRRLCRADFFPKSLNALRLRRGWPLARTWLVLPPALCPSAPRRFPTGSSCR
jgi:putative DNA primase/helicase